MVLIVIKLWSVAKVVESSPVGIVLLPLGVLLLLGVLLPLGVLLLLGVLLPLGVLLSLGVLLPLDTQPKKQAINHSVNQPVTLYFIHCELACVSITLAVDSILRYELVATQRDECLLSLSNANRCNGL